tara:strand:- start:23 stop:382 length:360 start_codon:yes stop_codon:yes gene_type:complete
MKKQFQRVEGQATSVAAATITSLSPVPVFGHIIRIHATLTSGSGATIAPILSEDSAVTSLIKQVASVSAAAHIDETPAIGIPYKAAIVSGVPTLYLKSTPNAAADNVVDYAIDIWPGQE